MKRAEKIIRQQISDLTFERMAIRKSELEQAIKFMYWQGTFRTKKYNQMLQLLENKYTELYDNFITQAIEASDREYKKFRKRYELDKLE